MCFEFISRVFIYLRFSSLCVLQFTPLLQDNFPCETVKFRLELELIQEHLVLQQYDSFK